MYTDVFNSGVSTWTWNQWLSTARQWWYPLFDVSSTPLPSSIRHLEFLSSVILDPSCPFSAFHSILNKGTMLLIVLERRRGKETRMFSARGQLFWGVQKTLTRLLKDGVSCWWGAFLSISKYRSVYLRLLCVFRFRPSGVQFHCHPLWSWDKVKGEQFHYAPNLFQAGCWVVVYSRLNSRTLRP